MKYRALPVIALVLVYAVLVRVLFGVNSWRELFAVMSITFLLLLPGIIGLITVYYGSTVEQARSLSRRLLMPWLPVGLFMLVTLLFTLEGSACWLMILPLFLITASLGGLLGGYFKVRHAQNQTYVSSLLLLPLLLSPIEQAFDSSAKTYRAYTCIDITAPAEVIWHNVTRVRKIPAAQDTGWLTQLLGFPRPVEAVLNYEGVGAYRKAIFTNGLVFHETVSEYVDRRKMVFSIKAYPHEIPAATMDEHVVIGGEYFDVLTGTYELEKRTPTTCRLHLYSRFRLHTRINAYASWWARWIMQDIQQNILRVEKWRAEHA